MLSKLDSKSKKLLDFLNNKGNVQSIKKLMENLLGVIVKDIKIYGVEEFRKIPEFNFKLVKLKVVFDNKTSDVYLKITNKYKESETIFCYWSFYREKYKLENSKKATIKKFYDKENNRKYNIIYLNGKNNIRKTVQVHLIDLNEIKDGNDLIKSENNWLLIGVA